MKRFLLGPAIAFGMAAPAQAEMTVAQFLSKADALQKKGAMAIFSSDLRPVVREMRSVGQQLKVEGERRKAAGLPRRACPPENARPKSDELLAMMNAIPPAERGMSLKDGFVRVMAARYPCR